MERTARLLRRLGLERAPAPQDAEGAP